LQPVSSAREPHGDVLRRLHAAAAEDHALADLAVGYRFSVEEEPEPPLRRHLHAYGADPVDDEAVGFQIEEGKLRREGLDLRLEVAGAGERQRLPRAAIARNGGRFFLRAPDDLADRRPRGRAAFGGAPRAIVHPAFAAVSWADRGPVRARSGRRRKFLRPPGEFGKNGLGRGAGFGRKREILPRYLAGSQP